MHKKRISTVIIAIVLCVMLLSSQITAFAEVKYDNIPYTDYTYWVTSSEKKAVATKPIYKPEKSIPILLDDSAASSELKHIVFDKEGKLYVLESGGKITVLNRDYTVNRTIKSLPYKNENLTFEGAGGIYVDKDDNLYICDTENARIIVSHNDVVTNVLTRPQSSVIPSDLDFAPIRIVKDERDYTYLLSDGCYYGLMVFNPQNEFLGFFGANAVSSTVLEALSGFITSIFETAEKHESSLKKLPYQIADICLANDGFVASVNAEQQGQVRVFSTTGENVLRYSAQFENSNGDSFNFADNPNSYLDKTSEWSHSVVQQFTSIASDKDGYLYALDKTQGRIYVYDECCNIIGVFGGGLGKGEQVGAFVTPVSLAVFEDEIAVLDSYNKNVTVYRETEYGNLLKNAQLLTNDGEYTKAFPLWEEVNKSDKNCQLAYFGLSKYYLEIKDYSKAMELSKSGSDRVVYSQAFRSYRNTWIKDNLLWIFLVAVVILAAAFSIPFILKKKGKTLKLPESITHLLSVILHPIKCFTDIKLYGKGSVVLATVVLVLYYVSAIAQKLLSGFMYRTVDVVDFNSIYTLLGTVGVMILFVVVNMAMCVLFEGKGRLKEIYCASCYCLVPKILGSLLYVVLSYVIVPTSNSNMSFLSGIFNIIFIIWILLSITVIHDFSFFKSIAMAIVIVASMGISAFVLFAVLTLAQDQLSFIIGIVKEYMLL